METDTQASPFVMLIDVNYQLKLGLDKELDNHNEIVSHRESEGETG